MDNKPHTPDCHLKKQTYNISHYMFNKNVQKCTGNVLGWYCFVSESEDSERCVYVRVSESICKTKVLFVCECLSCWDLISENDCWNHPTVCGSSCWQVQYVCILPWSKISSFVSYLTNQTRERERVNCYSRYEWTWAVQFTIVGENSTNPTLHFKMHRHILQTWPGLLITAFWVVFKITVTWWLVAEWIWHD